jgi:hypothetical protein
MRSLDQYFAPTAAPMDVVAMDASPRLSSSLSSLQPQSPLCFDTAFAARVGLHANTDLHRVSKVIRNWLPLASEMALWVADMPMLDRLLAKLESDVETLSVLAGTSSADKSAIDVAVAQLSRTAAQLDRFLRDAASHACGSLAS